MFFRRNGSEYQCSKLAKVWIQWFRFENRIKSDFGRMIETTFRSVFDGKSKQDPGPDKFKSKFDKNWMLNLNRKPTRRRCEIFYNWNPVVTRFYVLISDVPDSLSGSGSGRILPFLSDIRIRPDLDMKKKSRSGSGRILI